MSTERKDLPKGLFFCAPWLLGLSLFLLYPLGKAFYYSLTSYSVLLPPVFVGGANYRELLSDDLFYKSLWNTTVYAVGSVTGGLLVSLVLALLLNMKVKGQAFYRTVFFLPSLMPVVATSMLWAFMYAGDGGIINALLAKLGVTGPTWLADPRFAKPALIIMALWGAGHAMVILLAGLQDVPESLHEAAIIDGAGFLARLFHITLPMLSPVLYFNMVMGTIGGFQVFAQAFIMTDATGAPDRSTLFLVLYLYNTGFSDLRMGYACAMAWVLFMVIAGLTLLLTRAARNWVFYDR